MALRFPSTPTLIPFSLFLFLFLAKGLLAVSELWFSPPKLSLQDTQGLRGFVYVVCLCILVGVFISVPTLGFSDAVWVCRHCTFPGVALLMASAGKRGCSGYHPSILGKRDTVKEARQGIHLPTGTLGKFSAQLGTGVGGVQ